MKRGKTKGLFQLRHGIIPACDVDSIERFREIVKSTCNVKGVVGYKIGFTLVLRYGLKRVVKEALKLTELPIIYDHQKAGTDIPELGATFASICSEAGIQGVIIFPQAGPQTEEAYIKALFAENLTPIVGGEMTHPKYLARDGGFIKTFAPREMYRLAANLGVEYFILPGNKPEMLRHYDRILSRFNINPKYCLPGIGRQGGDIKSAFTALRGREVYVIIGSGIYKARNMKIAAETYYKEILSMLD